MAGIVKVMATDGGSHPPEKYAMATAELLTPIDPAMPAERQIAATALRAKFATALIKHHRTVKSTEIDRLKTVGHDHLDAPLDADEHVANALPDVVAASVGSPWETQHAQPEVQDVLGREIGRMFRSAMDEERQWHCHRNRGVAKCDAYLDSRHAGLTSQE